MLLAPDFAGGLRTIMQIEEVSLLTKERLHFKEENFNNLRLLLNARI